MKKFEILKNVSHSLEPATVTNVTKNWDKATNQLLRSFTHRLYRKHPKTVVDSAAATRPKAQLNGEGPIRRLLESEKNRISLEKQTKPVRNPGLYFDVNSPSFRQGKVFTCWAKNEGLMTFRRPTASFGNSKRLLSTNSSSTSVQSSRFFLFNRKYKTMSKTKLQGPRKRPSRMKTSAVAAAAAAAAAVATHSNLAPTNELDFDLLPVSEEVKKLISPKSRGKHIVSNTHLNQPAHFETEILKWRLARQLMELKPTFQKRYQ